MNTPKFNLKRREDIITEVRRYELITPLFGGGVKPQEPDPVSTVRAASVRGQLRFWWRATRGGQFASLDELRKAEEVLWGGAAVIGKDGKLERGGPGLVQVEVAEVKGGERYVPYEIVERNGKYRPRHKDQSSLAYFDFPLQPTEQEQKQNIPQSKMKGVTVGVQFQVTLCISVAFPESCTVVFHGTPHAEVLATLWAWETFGGIGGRIRRGFGALNRADAQSLTLANQQVIQTIHADWDQHVIETHQHPHLSQLRDKQRNLKVAQGAKWGEPIRAWEYLAEQLKLFRQHRDPETGNSRTPGRSHWPEPDSIRLALGNSSRPHPPRLTVRKFPRAAFGLPIITKFKDDKSGDPQKTSLQPKGSTRRASPLILRPALYRDAQGELFAVAIALILSGDQMSPTGLQLVDDSGRKFDVSDVPLTIADAQEIKTHPQLLGGKLDLTAGANDEGTIDILRAFLDTL